MVALTLHVTDKQGDMFGAAMNKRLQKFVDADKAARRAAAMTATSLSRSTWENRRDKRDVVASRAGRESTGGHLGSMIDWRAGTVKGMSVVALDINRLTSAAPHWIIQEIGTGNRATVHKVGQSNPLGRPAKGANYIRTVKSQRGRVIKAGLVFATSGGRFSFPGSARHQQIQLASQVTGIPGYQPPIVIQREIHGQHFVQRGGNQGFSQYRTSVLGAARQAFRKNYRP